MAGTVSAIFAGFVSLQAQTVAIKKPVPPKPTVEHGYMLSACMSDGHKFIMPVHHGIYVAGPVSEKTRTLLTMLSFEAATQLQEEMRDRVRPLTRKDKQTNSPAMADAKQRVISWKNTLEETFPDAAGRVIPGLTISGNKFSNVYTGTSITPRNPCINGPVETMANPADALRAPLPR